jgi:hypothetical protein
VDIVEDVTGSGLVAAWLKRGQLTNRHSCSPTIVANS